MGSDFQFSCLSFPKCWDCKCTWPYPAVGLVVIAWLRYNSNIIHLLQFKAQNSVIFSIITKFCGPHHSLILGHCHYPKRAPILRGHLAAPLPILQPQATTLLLLISMDFKQSNRSDWYLLVPASQHLHSNQEEQLHKHRLESPTLLLSHTFLMHEIFPRRYNKLFTNIPHSPTNVLVILSSVPPSWERSH